MSVSNRIFKVAAVFSACAIAIVSSGCSGDPVKEEIVTSITDQIQFSYETAKAQYMTIEEEAKIPASLDYAQSEAYYAPIDAKVKTNNISKNMKVKKGDVLIALDTTDLDFQINDQEMKVAAMADGVDKGYAQIELDKLKEQRAAAVVTAPYDGVIAECCYSAVGSNVKSGTLLCRVAVLESIFVYNSQGAGKNLRFGMDVDLVINDVDYTGTVTAAPDTAPSDATKDATKYCAVTLSKDSLDKLLNENNGITAVDAGWATIHAITTRRVNVLAVPEQAIKKDGSKTYCSVLQGNEKYDLYVEVGATAGGYVEILSGLNEGDVVVLSESTGNGSNNTDNKNNNKDDNEDGDDNRKPWDNNKKPPEDMQFPDNQNN